MKKSASLYQTKCKLIFCSNAQTVIGVWVSIPPYIHLEKNTDANEIVKALNEVLLASKTNVPHPNQDEWSNLSKMHLEGLRVKSLSALHDQADYYLITEEDDELKFSPTENAGSRGGYNFFSEVDLIVPKKSSPKNIVETLKEALYLSSNS